MANKNPKTKKTEAPAARSLPPTTKAAKTTAGAKPPVPKKASAPVKTTEKAAPNAAKQTAETKAPEGKKTVSAPAKSAAKQTMAETKATKTQPANNKKAAVPAKADNKPDTNRKQAEKAAVLPVKSGESAKKQPVKQPQTDPAKKTEKESASSKREKAKPAASVKPKTNHKQNKANTTSEGSGSAVAALLSNQTRIIIMAAVAFVLILAIVLGIVLGTRSCGKGGSPFETDGSPIVLDTKSVGNDNPTLAAGLSARPVVAPSEEVEGEKYEYDYSATTQVGFSGQVLGTVERVKPVVETKNEGLPSGYPRYGSTLSNVVGGTTPEEQAARKAARQALIEESDYLCALGTSNNSGNGNNGDGTYTWMDKDGFLYSGTTAAPVQATNPNGTPRQLYKHSAAEGMYLGGFNNTSDLSDNENGIVKRVTIRPRGYSSYSVTGLYAPAGEVIKIEMSEADMEATGGITVHIGQALYNGQSNNIWADKGQMQRFPNILNTMTVNKNTAVLEDGIYTAYVGSFIGGPIYIRNTRDIFTATVSGGVAYSHFILGYTTKEEFEANKNTTVPFFDLEVWNYGVLHSGPKYYVQNLSYEDLYKAAILWEKVSSVTTTGSNQGVVFLYDPFVAAGAAVAFPGRSSVNCPAGWMSNSLNYNSIVSSGGWGNFHEYHHNFQGYGVGAGGEVTNNGMTLVSYALFTKISAKRGISGFGAQGLGGWNNYTSATFALEETFKISRQNESPSNGDRGLALYATLLHNFGANNYIQAKYCQRSKHYGENYSGYFKAWEDITHNDMTYYFTELLTNDQTGLTAQRAAEIHKPEYGSMFVPVSCVYQTGRSYMYDGEKKYFQTMQPYVIPYGKEFNIDLGKYSAPSGQYESGSIVIPEGFDYRIKSVTKPAHGTVEITDNYNIKFTPDENIRSGQIVVTLEIVKKDGSFKVDDVDLVLEFEQSHETNKMTLERTTYSYTAENMYTDAETAYENNFANYASVTEKEDHSNPVQNCNTDIWFYPDTEQNRKDHANSPESHFVHPNTIEVLEGKLYFEEAGTYRIYLRGRVNCAVYYSLDGGKTYRRGAAVKNGSGSGFYLNNPDSYFNLENLEEHTWVYIKEILIVQSSPVVSYIGLGYGKWTEPMFTMVEKYYDENDNEVESPTADGYSYTKIHYYDYQGHEVSEEEANAAQLIPPTSATYVNAYRSDYEFPDNTGFKSDYFYTRNYLYSYNGDEKFLTPVQTVTNSAYTPWDNTPTYALNNLFDENDDTFIHSKNGLTAANPFSVTVKLDAPVTASRLTFHGSKANGGKYQTYMPKSYNIWVSGDGSNWTQVYSVTNSAYTSDYKQIADFGGFYTFSYYKVEVTATHARNNLGYLCLNKIELSSLLTLSNGKQFSPDNTAFTYGGDWQIKQAQSTFGHVYAGKANAAMSFKFNGTRLALLSSEVFGKNVEVTIDGIKVNSIELKAIKNGYGVSYISELLEDKEHTVVIRCLGEANIDSVVIYS